MGITDNELGGLADNHEGPEKKFGAHSLHEAPAPSLRWPRQLPPVPPWLIGRDALLSELDHIWSRVAGADQRRLVVLNGMGGVGKTALAVAWLYRRSQTFSQTNLYVDLHGSRLAQPADPGEVLRGFLIALGVSSADIPAEVSQRAALFRTATADHRVAVLLDDVASAAQVLPLLPAGLDSMTIVTSRWRLSDLGVEGAHFAELTPLTARESQDMLVHALGADRVAAEQDAADTIIGVCGGLPLALSISAARMRARPLRRLAREAAAYTRRAAETDTGAVGVSRVESVFDAAYDGLPKSAALVYRACGVHPGPFVSAEVMADVLGRTVGDVEDDIEELVEANLLTDIENDRLAQHELLQRDARSRAEREMSRSGREAMLRAIAQWYLQRMLAADELIHPYRARFATREAATPAVEVFGDRAAAVAWFRVDLPAIRAVMGEAGLREWDEIVWQFSEAAWGFFLHHRDYQSWIALAEDGVVSARRLGKRLVEARLRSQLGFTYAKLGRFDKAAEENVIALRLGQQENHRPTQATALSQLGRAARGQGDWEGALDFYRQSADLHAEAGIPRGVALCQRRSGAVLADLGRYDEAVVELTASAATMAQLGDTTQHSRAVMTLAKVHSRRGDSEQAVELLTEALQTVRSLDSPYYIAEMLTAFGQVERERGHDEQGRGYLAEARELYAEIGDPRADDLMRVLGEVSQP